MYEKYLEHKNENYVAVNVANCCCLRALGHLTREQINEAIVVLISLLVFLNSWHFLRDRAGRQLFLCLDCRMDAMKQLCRL